MRAQVRDWLGLGGKGGDLDVVGSEWRKYVVRIVLPSIPTYPPLYYSLPFYRQLEMNQCVEICIFNQHP